MVDLLITDLDADLVDRLSAQALRHERSLEVEIKAILESAAQTYSIQQAVLESKRKQRGAS